MAQFGMQMPASKKKASGLNVYTFLSMVACVALAAACAVMFMYGSKVGPNGKAWELQQVGKISLPASK
jgi:hypothetical protein